jgi:hypothetical protein
MSAVTRDQWENKPAGSLRMMWENAVPQRAADGRYTRHKDMERQCLHDGLRAMLDAKAAEEASLPPSAERAGRIGRAACVVVFAVGICVALAASNPEAAALASVPLAKLWHAAIGSIG